MYFYIGEYLSFKFCPATKTEKREDTELTDAWLEHKHPEEGRGDTLLSWRELGECSTFQVKFKVSGI